MDPDPLAKWSGAFGDAYVARNQPTDEMIVERAEGFRRCLPVDVSSALEVGANVGINMQAIRTLRPELRLGAVEPNATAREALLASGAADNVYAGDAYDIPVADGAYDLAFTAGVLIHVPPDRLHQAMTEIGRTANRYVLCMEYFSQRPEVVTYHGQEAMLWKRDFGSAWLDALSGLRCVNYGFLWAGELGVGWDDITWWLFEMAGAAS